MHIMSKKLSGVGATALLALALTASAHPNFQPFGMRHAARSPGTVTTIGGGKREIQKRASQEITSVIGCEAKGQNPVLVT